MVDRVALFAPSKTGSAICPRRRSTSGHVATQISRFLHEREDFGHRSHVLGDRLSGPWQKQHRPSPLHRLMFLIAVVDDRDGFDDQLVPKQPSVPMVLLTAWIGPRCLGVSFSSIDYFSVGPCWISWRCRDTHRASGPHMPEHPAKYQSPRLFTQTTHLET